MTADNRQAGGENTIVSWRFLLRVHVAKKQQLTGGNLKQRSQILLSVLDSRGKERLHLHQQRFPIPRLTNSISIWPYCQVAYSLSHQFREIHQRLAMRASTSCCRVAQLVAIRSMVWPSSVFSQNPISIFSDKEAAASLSNLIKT